MVRPLAPDEKALWEKVIATVRPLEPRPFEPEAPAAAQPAPPAPLAAKPRAPAPRTRPPVPKPKPPPANTLDGTWDRRLSRGLLQPDVTVDLHGHDLGSAYSHLDSRLEQAIAMGARLLLLITGKPPTSRDRPVRRGAIRAAVGDWLAASRHASDIAAVRAAHPRHGGAGALYIILRRPKRSE
jgi:DNA-nicking Smr family endonuclease